MNEMVFLEDFREEVLFSLSDLVKGTDNLSQGQLTTSL